MKKVKFVLLLVSALLWLGWACVAQDGARLTPDGELESEEGSGVEDAKDKSFSLFVQGIIRHDTNPELVEDGEEEDWCEVLRLAVDRKFHATGKHEFGGGYSFYGEFYTNITERNLVGHVFSLYHSADFEPWLIQTHYLFSHYLLDQETYLRKHTLAPMVFYVSGKKTLEMARVAISANDYPEADTLEGTDFSVQIRHFYFLDDAKKKRLSIGYKYKNVETDDDAMSYVAHQFTGDAIAPLGRGFKGRVRVDFTGKDYDEGRNDNRMRYALEIAKPLKKPWMLLIGHESTDNDSDDNNSDYRRGITVLSVSAAF